MMVAFNPYLVDEIVAAGQAGEKYFGLIDADGDEELHGYEVTMEGRVVVPMLTSNQVGRESGGASEE